MEILLGKTFDDGVVVETVTAAFSNDRWVVHVETAVGVVSRAATEAEAEQFELQANPPAPEPNPVQLVASTVIAAVEAAPNTVAGTQAAIITALSNFL